MSSTTELVTKARFMRNASPQAYDAFCKAFEAYAEDKTAGLIMATENVQLNQGYVRQCISILKALEEAKND
jgi:ABC-type transporter MlaC component